MAHGGSRDWNRNSQAIVNALITREHSAAPPWLIVSPSLFSTDCNCVVIVIVFTCCNVTSVLFVNPLNVLVLEIAILGE
jgi:hypothetical protein